MRTPVLMWLYIVQVGSMIFLDTEISGDNVIQYYET